MKNNLMFFSFAALLASCTGVSVENAKINTELDSVSYVIGVDYGVNIAEQIGTFPGGMNSDMFLEAFVEAYQGKDAAITVEDPRTYVMDYVGKAQVAVEDTTQTEYNPVNKDSVSYLIGTDYGSGIFSQMKTFPGGMNNVAFLDAFVCGFNGDSAKFKVVLDDADRFIMDYVGKAQLEAEKKAAEESEELAAAGKTFLEENARKEGVITTGSGLQYKVIKEGKGKKPKSENRVKVHYHGTLIDGTVFDSSVERGQPAEFGVTQVIQGWIEALQLMPVGSKYMLYIPQELAYGSRNAGSIPPFSTLIFEVELLEILN